MGTVWVGEHTLLGRRAAIKVLLPELTSREEIVQRFFNEARAVTSISDPGIVQVFDFGHALGSAYIVMELLEGEAMDVRLRRIGRFSPVDAMRLMAQVATSLGAAHAKGVIHRDLKPENIYIVGDPAVTGGERTKILDFGIAKLAGDDNSNVKTRTGMVMGTPVYMSPEQCRGASGIDARSDIYALGCVLFTMVCGKPPFESEATGDLIIMHVRDAPPIASSIVPSLPPVLDAVIARCLEKDPARRFQNTAELVQGLASVEAVLFANPAYRHNPTPAPHDAYTQIAQHQKPTTLSSANGATPTGPGATMAPKKRRGLVIAGLATVIAIAGVAVTLGSGSAVTPVAVAPVDAQTVATPQPLPVDAAALVEVDAAVVAADPVDAGVAAAMQTKVIDNSHAKHSLPKGGGHTQKGSNAGTTSTGSVDRGD